ncbi:hypothetical protein E2C01_042969 [Portunus trituberculatus]|uniref:Uncharacterized protein n=1 Tax=Portunus trituberculatus TaxID=210409 RepID=A0A5B7FW30_PORTR|nr:hypothetical protein [Portunus trituberculatus]
MSERGKCGEFVRRITSETSGTVEAVVRSCCCCSPVLWSRAAPPGGVFVAPSMLTDLSPISVFLLWLRVDECGVMAAVMVRRQ